MQLQVLYVYETITGKSENVMAATRGRSLRTSSNTSVAPHPVDPKEDIRLNFPIQVALPDGERFPYKQPLRHFGGPEQEADMKRPYIKPPPNKTLLDVEAQSPYRSNSLGALASQKECLASFTSCGIPTQQYLKGTIGSPHHRHSAPTDDHLQYGSAHLVDSSQIPHGFFVNTALSSSSSNLAVCCEERGSAPKSKKSGGKGPFIPSVMRIGKGSLESRKRSADADSGGGFVRFCFDIPSTDDICYSHEYDQCPPVQSSLSDVISISCGAAGITSPQMLSVLGHEDYTEDSDQSSLLPPPYSLPDSEDTPPPVYSDVIANPCLYRNVERTSEQWTNRGKI